MGFEEEVLCSIYIYSFSFRVFLGDIVGILVGSLRVG